MSFFLTYIIYRFFWRIYEFLKHWYYGGTKQIIYFWFASLRYFDRFLAFKINLENFWKPMYGDYSLMGRILSLIFRFLRFLTAIVLYFLISALFLVLVLIWNLIPPGLIFLSFLNYGKVSIFDIYL